MKDFIDWFVFWKEQVGSSNQKIASSNKVMAAARGSRAPCKPTCQSEKGKKKGKHRYTPYAQSYATRQNVKQLQ